MTEIGETTGFCKGPYRGIFKHSYRGIIDKVMINDKKISKRYA